MKFRTLQLIFLFIGLSISLASSQTGSESNEDEVFNLDPQPDVSIDRINRADQPDPALELWIIHAAGFGQRIENYDFRKDRELTLDFIPVSSHDSFYQLRCYAKYPIKVRYVGEGTPKIIPLSYRWLDSTNIVTESDATAQLNDERLNDFEVRVNITVREGNTGGYVCQGLQTSTRYLDSKVYLYIPGPKIFIGDTSQPLGLFRMQSDHMNEIGFNSLGNLMSDTSRDVESLFVQTNRRVMLIIPCAISSPGEHIVVTLFEDFRHDDGSITSKDITASANFYAKQGFILKQHIRFETPREFRCTAFNRWKSRKKPAQISFLAKPWLVGPNINTTMKIDYELSVREESISVNCRVMPEHLKVFFGRKNCYSQMHCQFLIEQMRKTNLPRWMGSENGVISLNYKQFPALPEFNETSISQQMLPLSGVFFCTCGRNRIQSLIYNFFVDSLVTDFEDIESSPKIDKTLQMLIELDEQSLTADFRCIGNAFFYSQGFKWAFEMNDGSFHFLSGEHLHRPTSSHIENKMRISSSLKPQVSNSTVLILEQVQSVTCFAPLWNSFGWHNTTIHPSQTQEDRQTAAYSHASQNQIKSQFLLFVQVVTISQLLILS